MGGDELSKMSLEMLCSLLEGSAELCYAGEEKFEGSLTLSSSSSLAG